MSADRKIKSLVKNNYFSWKIQIKALLVKFESWPYVFKKTPKPESSGIKLSKSSI